MSALTAAAAAAQPNTPTALPPQMSPIPNSIPSSGHGVVQRTNVALLPASVPQQPGSQAVAVGVGQSTLGKVVESGHEHTGRWTKEEHEAFLSALQLYGKEWKKVAARVKTRTVVQTRTHAQKYFQKLQKVLEVSYCVVL